MNSANAVLVVMDPVPGLKPKKDTSLGLVREAQTRGYPCFVCDVQDLSLCDGTASAQAQSLQVDLTATPFYSLGPTEQRPLSSFRWILMRKDPPVDADYIFATQLFDYAGPNTKVLNRPSTLRNINEKLAIGRFPELCAPTITSASAMTLRAFAREQGQAVMKPLDGMGGKSIFRVQGDDPNLSVVIETLTNSGRRLAMAQAYLPAISEGDKRVLMINGEPWPRLLARIPASGEARGNLAAGGRGEVRDLGPAEAHIAQTVGPWLREQGVLFAGLDVIGNRLTEINITSPTCVREIEDADGSNICAALWDAFEAADLPADKS